MGVPLGYCYPQPGGQNSVTPLKATTSTQDNRLAPSSPDTDSYVSGYFIIKYMVAAVLTASFQVLNTLKVTEYARGNCFVLFKKKNVNYAIHALMLFVVGGEILKQ